jgi:ATP-dependent protease ClpP protease subunit
MFDMFGGEVFSASDVVKFLQDHKDDQNIAVEISSDGGYKSEGVEIYHLLKNSGKTITTVIYKANSIATVIALSGSTRLIVENAPFVVHFARIDPVNLGIDPLTSEDLQRLADETERADKQILDIYCSELGEEKRTELIAAMADERDLGSKGAIKLGFATGYYKKKKKEKMSVEDFRSVLITDTIAELITNNMAKENESKLEKMFENFSRLITKAVSKIKNEVTLPLQDGTSIYAVPANPEAPDDLMGAKVFLIDEAGMPTENPVEDGEVTLQDGRVLVVVAGVVSEVREAVDAAKLQEELAAKAAALEEATAEIANLKTQMESMKTEMKKVVDNIQNQFNEFKKQVPGDKKATGGDDNNEDVDLSKMSIGQRFIYNRKQQIKMEKQSNVQ